MSLKAFCLEIKNEVLLLGSMVEEAVMDSAQALKDNDLDRSSQVILNDLRINRKRFEIEISIVVLMATQQPVARDLRDLMGVQYIASELERMGDYAVRIARMTGTLCGLPDRPLRAEFGLMGELAIKQVHDILEALIHRNVNHAREVASHDNEVDRLWHRTFEELVAEMGKGTDPDGALRAVTLLLVAHNLERIADRVTNVAEDIVFLETGQVVELG